MAANRRVNSTRSDYYREQMYVDGNTVRKTTVVTRPRPQAIPQERPVSREASRNRAKAMQMSKGYVLFLALVSVATLFVCVRYIQLRSTVTAQLKSVASLESQLNELTAENDALYNQVVNNVNLEQIKDVAMNQYGMNYATEDQIIWYSNNTSQNYMRQYQDVPGTK